MDYADVLGKCRNPEVGHVMTVAVTRLLDKQRDLLQRDTSERAIASQLAQIIALHFPAHQVDVEYNRMGDAPKTVAWDDKPERVFPDIIVHSRGSNDENILVIELKKSSNPESKNRDVQKLRAYRRELAYQHALFIRLGVLDLTGVVVECEWVLG